MDEHMAKFEERLKELVQLGKKKKGILEIQEINDFFHDMDLDSEQMEKVFEYLEATEYRCASYQLRSMMILMIRIL